LLNKNACLFGKSICLLFICKKLAATSYPAVFSATQIDAPIPVVPPVTGAALFYSCPRISHCTKKPPDWIATETLAFFARRQFLESTI
jgi:hypothetical protein